MKFFSFLFTKTFFKNLLAAIIILIVLFIALTVSLRIYTHHGKAVVVPDLRGLTQEEAAELLSQNELRFEVSDSIYSDTIPKGTVAEQIPRAGSKVKKNRKLFLIFNSVLPRMVPMPDLSDLSLRYAISVIESAGLKAGKTIRVYSEFNNLVIGQHYNGMSIEAGTPIAAGSTIDILVANGLSDKETLVPALRGMLMIDASKIIRQKGLNIGAVIKDEENDTNQDSLRIWQQIPSGESTSVKIGSSVSLWITSDSLKWIIPQDTMLIEQ